MSTKSKVICSIIGVIVIIAIMTLNQRDHGSVFAFYRTISVDEVDISRMKATMADLEEMKVTVAALKDTNLSLIEKLTECRGVLKYAMNTLNKTVDKYQRCADSYEQCVEAREAD